jgi:hypothetical protein
MRARIAAAVAGVAFLLALPAAAAEPTKPAGNLPNPAAETVPHPRMIRPSKAKFWKGRQVKSFHQRRVANKPK